MPEVKLKVTHTHAGVAYPAGHVIDVDEHTAHWLAERGIAIPVNGERPRDLESTPPTPRSKRTLAPKE